MNDCIFCKIANKEIKSEIIYDDENIAAFLDVNPQAPHHIIIIPKDHIEKIEEIKDYSIVGRIFRVINHIVELQKLNKDGFRVVANSGRYGGQSVFHLHFHLLGGRPFGWPPG